MMDNMTATAIAQLTGPKNRAPIPASLRLDGDLASPGLYGWFANFDGAAELSKGLQAAIDSDIVIYAGQAGATKWPSGKQGSQNLKGRLERNHIWGKQRSSTFRRTLAGILRFDQECDLTSWMQAHLSLATFSHADRDTLMALEHAVITEVVAEIQTSR